MKILIVQAGFGGIVRPVIERLRERDGAAGIYLCTASGDWRYNFSEEEGLAGFLDFSALSTRQLLPTIRRLRNERFDLIVVTDALLASNQLVANIFAYFCRGRRVERVDSRTGTFRVIDHWSAFRNLFRRHFLVKFINQFLVRASLRLRPSRTLGQPLKLFLESCSLCNISCPGCPTGLKSLSRKQGLMPLEKYKGLLDDCGKYIQDMRLHLFGEPLLNENIAEMVAYAKGKDIPFIEISTNGNIAVDDEYCKTLIRSGLDSLIISMDGVTPETYSVYRRGGKISKLILFTEKMAAMKRELGVLLPVIDVQFIVMKHNEHELAQARELSAALGADNLVTHFFDVGFCPEGVDAAQWLPENNSYSQYTNDDDGLRVKGERAETCSSLWDTLYVTWEGDILPCCYDGQARNVLGNLFTSGVRRTWNGGRIKAFRKQVLKDRNSIELCRSCIARPQ